MDPGGRYGDEDGGERPPGWPSRPMSDRVAVLENELRHLNANLAQLRESIRLLGDERRMVGDGLRADINLMSNQLAVKFDALDKRLETIETERTELKFFKRRLLTYAAYLSAGVAGAWQVVQVVFPWLRGIFDRGAP